MRSFAVPLVTLASLYLFDATYADGMYFTALRAVVLHIAHGIDVQRPVGARGEVALTV